MKVERFLFDFTAEVRKFIDNSDRVVEDLGYKVDQIVSYFKEATDDIEFLAEHFWKTYLAGTPKDSFILASQAVHQLYPSMSSQLLSQGIEKKDVVGMDVKYVEDSSNGTVECFTIVFARVRSSPNDLPKGYRLLS